MPAKKTDQLGRRLLPEDTVFGTKQPDTKLAEKPFYSSFEEAVANSEQLQARPPVGITESGLGSTSYLTQPFQHLSWYPR